MIWGYTRKRGGGQPSYWNISWPIWTDLWLLLDNRWSSNSFGITKRQEKSNSRWSSQSDIVNYRVRTETRKLTSQWTSWKKTCLNQASILWDGIAILLRTGGSEESGIDVLFAAGQLQESSYTSDIELIDMNCMYMQHRCHPVAYKLRTSCTASGAKSEFLGE